MTDKTTSDLTSENAELRLLVAKLEMRSPKRSLSRRTRLTNYLTKRSQIELAFRDSESRYRRLFETAKDGILLLDAISGQITDVNPFLIELLGYSREELLGKRLWEIGLFKDVASSQAAFRELQQKQYIRYEELPLETKRGKRAEVEFVSNVYRVNGKKVIQCNIRDITERIRTKDRIRKVNDELSALVAKLQKQEREMHLVNSMNDMLQTCKTQTEAYQVITLALGELFDVQSGGLAIMQPSGQYLETVARWGTEPLIDSVFSMDDCWALRRGQLHEVVNPSTSMLCHHFIRPPETGYICLPLMVQGETLGLLYLSMPAEDDSDHSSSPGQLIRTVSEGIKLSLSNLKLREAMREQAIQDPLTGLFNRRYLSDTLPRELHRAQRHSSPISIALMDIDHFKNFNDTFGHEAGDLLLTELGRVLRENIRQSDIICRYGGEEFVLVLPDTSLPAGCQHIEKIHALVKSLQVRYREQQIGPITLSIGISQFPEHGLNADDLLRAADEAMYVAKTTGRDRIVVYGDDVKK
jgi:diguanylate cyclase (GGDEF)-like protein/PAS domain S-box-containing protein